MTEMSAPNLYEGYVLGTEYSRDCFSEIASSLDEKWGEDLIDVLPRHAQSLTGLIIDATADYERMFRGSGRFFMLGSVASAVCITLPETNGPSPRTLRLACERLLGRQVNEFLLGGKAAGCQFVDESVDVNPQFTTTLQCYAGSLGGGLAEIALVGASFSHDALYYATALEAKPSLLNK